MIYHPEDFLVNKFQKKYTIEPLFNFFMDFLGRYVILLRAHVL